MLNNTQPFNAYGDHPSVPRQKIIENTRQNTIFLATVWVLQEVNTATECRTESSTFVCTEMRHPIMLFSFPRVNCAVLTGSSAGLRTVFSSRLSHRELRSSVRQFTCRHHDGIISRHIPF